MTDRDARIRNVVAAWRAEQPGSIAALDQFPDDERAESIRQLGYTPAMWIGRVRA